MDARHLVVLMLFVAAVAIGAGMRALSSLADGTLESWEGLPTCNEGPVAVAWPGDGERVGCLEDLRSLIELAAEESDCAPPFDEPQALSQDDRVLFSVAVNAGDRVLLRADEQGRCELTVAALPGAQRLALGVPIDVNAASESDLLAIRGIGPVRAGAIVADREENGPYESVEELARVRGIGPITVQRVAPYVKVLAPGDS